MHSTYILGLSAYYHDSAASLIRNGKIIAAAQEERFTRIKHDSKFPSEAINYCLKEANITLSNVSHVIFYDKPLVKFERLLETYLSYAPKGFSSFISAMPIWIKEKLFLKTKLKKKLAELGGLKKTELPNLYFNDHHNSHAASAFYPSPFEKAAVLCLDGVGEWATSSLWIGEGNKLIPKWQINFPHSLGLLYSAFTYYTGFKVNSGEYKLMGLAPYGEPKYVDLIKNNLVDIKEDGTFSLDMSYFNYGTGLTMTNSKFDKLFEGPPRKSETNITQREMDIARSIQVVTEEIILKIVNHVHDEFKLDNICLAGGVALNCVANGRILKESKFKNIWIQPAAGDAGGALGAALTVWYEYLDNSREPAQGDSMQGSFLGPRFDNNEISSYLDLINAKYQKFSDKTLTTEIASILASENVVGWFQGRMEFGPRALGGRSIIGDARNVKMQSVMNLKIKYRESFRPFAPAVLAEKVTDWFEISEKSPYMLLVSEVKKDKQQTLNTRQKALFGMDKLNVPRSQIPAVTHVDYSARIQTVHKETNPRFHSLLKVFEKKTKCPILINTSFNVRGEPIVCSPEDAYRCFMRTEMDYLVLENFILKKHDQPEWEEKDNWQEDFIID